MYIVEIIYFDDCCRAAKLQPTLASHRPSQRCCNPCPLQAMSLPRVVPWRDWAEWQTVYAGLYANDPEPRMRAVARCRTWRLRGNVPHAIEATSSLVAIDDLDAQTASLARAAAVTRAVNGALDIGQTGRDARPLNQLAEQAGLPAWLVDVRHGVTHQKLPADGVLRAACDELLRFFDATYWRPQSDHLQSLRSASVKLVEDVLRAFQSSKKKRKRKINKEFLATCAPATLANVVVPVLVESELFASDAAAEALVKELSAAWPAARLAICAALVARSHKRASTWIPRLASQRDVGVLRSVLPARPNAQVALAVARLLPARNRRPCPGLDELERLVKRPKKTVS